MLFSLISLSFCQRNKIVGFHKQELSEKPSSSMNRSSMMKPIEITFYNGFAESSSKLALLFQGKL
jgi:hypothetical protein